MPRQATTGLSLLVQAMNVARVLSVIRARGSRHVGCSGPIFALGDLLPYTVWATSVIVAAWGVAGNGGRGSGQ